MQTFEIILFVISGLSLICALGALIFLKGGKAKLLGGFAVLNSKYQTLQRVPPTNFSATV